VDAVRKPLIGEKACNNFYKHYKDLAKIEDQNENLKIKGSVYTGMLHQSKTTKLLPVRVGVIKDSGSSKTLSIRNHMLGNKYIGVVAEGISRVDYDKIDCKNNRLTGKGAKTLVQSLRPCHKSLDLSNNGFGRASRLLASILNNPETKLQILNLNKNYIGDAAGNEILGHLMDNKNLKALHLNENNLTDRVAEKLAELIYHHDKLSELYIRWNNFTSFGGRKIFQVLIKNEQLRVADFGWNLFGESYKVLRTEAGLIDDLCNFLQDNKTLMHLDISNNHFTLAQAERISKALRRNNTIYGLHFTGNKGYMNSEAYLVVDDPDFEDNFSPHISKPLDSMRRSEFNNLSQYDSVHEIKNICWICDAWLELEFEWSDNEKLRVDIEDAEMPEEHGPVFLHFKHEDYRPIWMKPDEDGKIAVKLMVPNTRLFFFFTVNNMATTSEDYQSIYLEQPEHVSYRIVEQKYVFLLQDLNLFETNLATDDIISDTDYSVRIESIPRRPRAAYRVAKEKSLRVTRQRWNVKMSVFKDYKPDHPALINKCFEVDWACGKYLNFIKDNDDRELTKEYMNSVYNPMRLCYKHVSSNSNMERLWCIGSNGITEIFSQLGVIDGNLLSLSNMDIEFKKVNYSTIKDVFNSTGFLIRYEFMEIMVRVAGTIFMDRKITNNWHDSVKQFFETYANQFFGDFHSQPFRDNVLWKEEVDYAIKQHQLIVDNVWHKYSGSKTLPGKKKWMANEEFRKLVYGKNFLVKIKIAEWRRS
jgi:hypothetical protein